MNRRVQHLANLQAALPDAVSRAGDARYAAALDIWAKTDTRPAMIVHCRNDTQVQRAVVAARDAGLALSVRGGGHDWAGRALCGDIVIDLTPMRTIALSSHASTVTVGGGTRATDLFAITDSLQVAAVTGSCGGVGLAGLTLGGGYGPLNGRFGLACDNLMSARVVLADGEIVTAGAEGDEELLWALRGGGGNFGVVTSLTLTLHDVSGVRSGLILYPFVEAQAVIEGLEPIAAAAPDALDIQVAFVSGPDGAPLLALLPTWSGPRARDEAQIAPLLALGTVVMADLRDQPYGQSRSVIDVHTVNGRPTTMAARWLARLDGEAAAILIEQIRRRPSPLCSMVTHMLHGAATRIAPEATAFGFRQPHIVVEILGQADAQTGGDGAAERAWVNETAAALDRHALPGGYPNFLSGDERERARLSFGPNADRLARAKRHYDPGNLFASALPLPL